MRGPTIRDVARHAGVSTATVSRVLNDSPLVLEPTRERVRASVDELGYRLNATARNLSIGRAMAIGVVVPFFTAPSVIERLRGVVERLGRGERREYDLMLFDVEAPEQRPFQQLVGRDRVAGLLIISLPVSDEEVAALARDELPAVLVDATHPALSRVVIDNVRGGELAAEHLLVRGHRRVGFVGDDPASSYGFTSSEDRRRGFLAALRRAGASTEPALERLGPHGREQAAELAAQLLSLPDPPSAIFAASDLQAIGVLKAAERLGVRVPEDLAVIGFDDVDLAEIVGLTTIRAPPPDTLPRPRPRHPLREAGPLAAHLLLATIEDGRRAPVETAQTLTVVE